MASRNDLRRRNRESSDGKVVVAWRDERGNDNVANAKALDVSDVGVRLEMPVPIRVQTYITMRAEKLGLHGQASVRHCSRKGSRYVIGAEFSAGLSRTRKPS